MKYSSLLRAAGACALVTFTACEDKTDLTGVDADLTGIDAVSVVVPTGAAGQVTVCKEAVGTREFPFNITALTGNVNLPEGTSFTLVRETCKLVAITAANLQRVRIAETLTRTFKDVRIYRWSGATKSQSLIDTSTNPEQTVEFGQDIGWVLVYRNGEDERSSAPGTASCTRTEGFWQTHPGEWPREQRPEAQFFRSERTWMETLKQNRSEAHFVLAREYIAAKLNAIMIGEGRIREGVREALSLAEKHFRGEAELNRERALEVARKLDRFSDGREGFERCR
jgi:hypothetical protein